MPGRTSPPVPPRVVISEPANDQYLANAYTDEGKLAATRKRLSGPSPAVKEPGDSWEDLDDEPAVSRRRRSKRSTHVSGGKATSSVSRPTVSRKQSVASESDFGRFFPRLSKILEGTESTVSGRSSARGSDWSRQSDRSLKRPRHRDDTVSIHRRPARHRSGGVQRRVESLLKTNPSLLSVLSGLTSTSDRSSGSNSTITQRSYNRRGSDSSKTPPARPRRSDYDTLSNMNTMPRSRTPNVFDYMQTPSGDDGHDAQSVISSTSSALSHYQASDASSEAPATPSSRSTFPSPTTTRRGSVAELRKRYDPHYAASSGSRGSAHSPASSLRSLQKQPSVSDVDEDDGEEQSIASPSMAPSEMNYNNDHVRHDSTHDDKEHRMRSQEDSIRQHMAYAEHPHQQYYAPTPRHPQDLRHSISSTSSDPAAAYAYHMALQHYQHPQALSPQAEAQLASHPPPQAPDRPPAPDAPDLDQRTIAGYELLATKLASNLDVKPLYRKFSYLHHRILLHLQDELAEMEDHLRRLDEIIAQSHAAYSHPPPASRRMEAWHGGDLFVQRRDLLGRIFMKTEQYQRALGNYEEASRRAAPATDGEVEAYKDFMATHQPIHEAEADFLNHAGDLISPSRPPQSSALTTTNPPPTATYDTTKQLAALPFLLTLPLLLFTLIPTLAGRLIATALIAGGTGLVAMTTSLGKLLSGKEWAICGTVYVLVMVGVAGCVP